MRRLITLAVGIPAWLFLSFNCSKATPSPGGTIPITLPDTTKVAQTYLALGDSYTIGQSVDASLRFPAQTAAWLISNGVPMQSPVYIAVTGWTTLNLQQGIQQENLKHNFDVVSLLIGVNDQYQHVDTATYHMRFEQLLQTSIRMSGSNPSHVFVLSIPDYSVTPFAQGSNTAQISKEIDWFNNINKQVTAQYNCHYLNITPSTREAATDASLIAGDGLHPSGKEYKKWADMLGPLMKSSLK